MNPKNILEALKIENKSYRPMINDVATFITLATLSEEKRNNEKFI